MYLLHYYIRFEIYILYQSSNWIQVEAFVTKGLVIFSCDKTCCSGTSTVVILVLEKKDLQFEYVDREI